MSYSSGALRSAKSLVLRLFCEECRTVHFITRQGPVAQRIRHLTTNQGIPGSNPGRVDFFYFSTTQVNLGDHATPGADAGF